MTAGGSVRRGPDPCGKPLIWSTAELRALDDIAVAASEVVYAFVAVAGQPSASDEALLDDSERARAERFVRLEDHDRFVLAHAALRLLLARCLGVEPATVRYAQRAHGKPGLGADLARLEFNMSHSGRLGLLAVARDRPVGVDVEAVRGMADALSIADTQFSALEREALRALAPSERRPAFFRCWTRKEAVIKADGEGLGRPLSSFDVDLAPGSTAALTSFDGRPAELAGWSLRDLAAPPGYVAAGAAAVDPGGAPARWRQLRAAGR
ncbi:MAG TPA: 4'-phosphopantetheinyl transferase superfamily protein [Solirubrobacteraceae bacterium]|nr:4'-phosphopantetheinyl transferase superfamily protein [Solirubrobacteraceae bacterium]